MLCRARLCDSKSSVRLSVCLSVTLRYVFHTGWNTSKIISRPNSLRLLLGLTPTWAIWCNGIKATNCRVSLLPIAVDFLSQRSVAIAPPHRGMARLSWHGWLVTLPRWFTRPQTTHSSTNRARRGITSLTETNALPLSQPATVSNDLHVFRLHVFLL